MPDIHFCHPGRIALLCLLLILARPAFSAGIIADENHEEWNIFNARLAATISAFNALTERTDPKRKAVLQECLRRLDTAQCILYRLAASPQEYGLTHVPRDSMSYTSYSPGKKGRKGKIVFHIVADSLWSFIHETTHGGQFEHGGIVFTLNGGIALGNSLYTEAEAYRQQFACVPTDPLAKGMIRGTKNTMPATIEEITPDWVRHLVGKDANGDDYEVYNKDYIAVDSISLYSDPSALRKAYPNTALWRISDSLPPLKDKKKFYYMESRDYSCPIPQVTGNLVLPPNHAIIPTPISIALSSILKVGVCTPDVIPFSAFITPSRKKHPGICWV